jgi:uncharacterized protein (TIGR02284 family)
MTTDYATTAETTADRSDVVDVLNDLIEVCKDGEYGFNECAEHAKAAAIKTTLSARARDCASGASELQALVKTYGGEPETGGTAGGAIHRGWVSIRSALTSKDDVAVLEEAERGEDKALKAYRDASAKHLPIDVQAVIRKQLQGTQANHDQIKVLRDSVKAAA